MAQRQKKNTSPTPVDATSHADTRTNIPTAELRDFVADDEKNPIPVMYPRDPSLDPQLVWRGKDEQDSEPLIVPTVPIYIQEKINPQVIIENLRTTAEAGAAEPELSLFDDFDGLEFDQLVDFYQYENNWSNRLILGDSLLVMNSLAEKENLKGQVQMIYIDPPYGIKFGSNWQVSTRKRTVSDGKDATRQPEQVKAFRDTWELGIHSYLAYLRDRLVTSRKLLTDSGSVFVQIGDENVHLVRSLLDEVFGAENCVSQIPFQTTGGAGSQSGTTTLAGVHSYLLWYARDIANIKYRQLFQSKDLGGDGASKYTNVLLSDGQIRTLSRLERDGGDLPKGARPFRYDTTTSQSPRSDGQFPVTVDGVEYTPRSGYWKSNRQGMARLALAGRLKPTSGHQLQYVRYLDDFPAFPLNNFWPNLGGVQSRSDPKVYVVQTGTEAIKRCLLMTTDPGDLVLDPTCGAGTTAVVAEEWGRRWITVDTSRVALALARTRLMTRLYPYYMLSDSERGARQEEALGGAPSPAPFGKDIRRGFVLARIPHITLRSIASNTDITEGMSQAQISEALLRHSEHELLHDRPLVEGGIVRVSGPFTVESLSPHRSLEGPAPDEPTEPATDDFETTIVVNLRKAGVQNTYAGERIKFDRLELLPGGLWIHADGDFTDADGQNRRLAISLGPEHGTVSPEQIKEAAKEALKGVGYDMLIVCGFAFDAHAGETAAEFAPQGNDFAAAAEERHYGRLRVLLARMNPDLTMGDELLKKTGSGNLFTVFGEPDVDIDTVDAEVTVEIHGVDVYDPTTGQVRSSSTEDIATWFIDTNYNSESFFVRHAYFTGAGDPFQQLARALKADINPEAWDQLYTTRSMPFPKPTTGRIAVKVINHYGDEVVKVYEVPTK